MVKKKILKILLALSSLIGTLLLWKLAILIFDYPTYILPDPILVKNRLSFLFETGKIYPHLKRTLLEILSGFILGTSLAVITGYVLAKRKWLKISLTPYIIGFQSIPIIALAPLFILWFGTGIVSKIIICALIVFFPIMINTVTALSNIESDKKDLLRMYNASSLNILSKLEIPHSLPYIFSSLKIGIVLSVIGAVVGEFIGADKGLGFLINSSLGLIDTPQLFAVIFILSTLGLAFYTIVSIIETFSLPYKKYIYKE